MTAARQLSNACKQPSSVASHQHGGRREPGKPVGLSRHGDVWRLASSDSPHRENAWRFIIETA
ncbi:MAG: hypothetical protein M3552_03095 [Planctomycetota bacterium]|nr:hypothetical protein [Planctomycetota bacterium]